MTPQLMLAARCNPWFAAWLAGFAFWAAVLGPADAHWNGPTDTALSAWYSAQHNGRGGWCCDKADGHDFYGAYAARPDGSVEFDANGAHYHLPAYMVLKGPNPTGHAVWWYADGAGGHYDYCFALGPEG